MYTDGKCMEASVYTHKPNNSVGNLFNSIRNPSFNVTNTGLQIEPVHFSFFVNIHFSAISVPVQVISFRDVRPLVF
jgi:hypothetical protein